MAKAARWIDASLLPEPHTKRRTTRKVDEDLQTRIRSLLISRNRHYPPRTPFPSPEYASSPYDLQEDYCGYSSQRAGSHSLSAARAVVKLADTEPGNSSVVTNRFDGPADPIAQSEMDVLQKKPGWPAFDEESSSKQVTPNSNIPSGLNSFAVGNNSKRDHRKSESSSAISSFRPPSRSMSQSSKKSTSSRIPVYYVRTVPPASSYLEARPEIPKMPGSYISEIDTTAAQGPPIISSMADSRSTKDASVSNSTRFNPGTNPETHSRAIEALRRAMDHDISEKASRLNPSLRKELSKSSLRSTTSTLNSRHLLKVFVGHDNASQAAEPVLTPSVSHGHSYSESVETPPSILSKRHGIKGANSSSTEIGSIENSDEQDSSNYQALLKNRDTFDVVDLPEESKAFDGLYSQFSAGQRKNIFPLSDKDKKHPKTHHSAILETNNLAQNMEIQVVAPEAKPGNCRDPGASSAILQKLSKIGRVMTGLSEKSLLPTIEMPFLRSPVNHKAVDGKIGKDQLSPSPSESRSENSNDFSDKERLVKISTSKEWNGPKKHWIQQLLARKSSNSLMKTDSNLTARSIRQSASQQRTGNPPSREELNANDNTLTRNQNINEEAYIDEQQKNPEPFRKIIEDLEGLLNEALALARRETDPAVCDISPSTSIFSVNHEPGFVHYSDNSMTDNSDDMSSCSRDLDMEKHDTGLPILYDYPSGHHQNRGQLIKAWDTSSNEDVLLKKVKAHSISQEFPVEVHDILENSFQTEHRDIINVSKGFETCDWAFNKPPHSTKPTTPTGTNLTLPQKPDTSQVPLKEQQGLLIRGNKPSSMSTSGAAVPRYITDQGPRIQPRSSSAGLRTTKPQNNEVWFPNKLLDEEFQGLNATDLQPFGLQYRTETQQTVGSRSKRGYSFAPNVNYSVEDRLSSLRDPPNQPNGPSAQDQGSLSRNFSLTGRRHHSLRGTHGFSLSRSHRRAPIARDWSTSRKRYVATVACINTALMGLIIGIYAGEVPAIQYAIVDEHHYTILGNVVFFIGLAITTALFWPLPLLHGRKPYTMAALALLLPLQFPQALAVGTTRSSDAAAYRVGLLLSRSFAGLIMGFANVNFKTTLLDLFGASLQSAHPHQETVNSNDVRWHGGGMGIWLGIWTWCSIGSIGVGFLLGAVVISGLDVSWGFWLTIIFTAFALILNVLVPEVRRSPYRRSMAEVQNGGDISRRIARGEIKMHIDSTGPKWWWEEVVAGHKLCLRMLKQPGFAVLALYMGWIYGQIVMVILLLGALTSKYYLLHPQYVGLCVAAVPLGALLAIPFQKASLFSRSRKQSPRTDSMTVRDQVTWTSHLVRRGFFMISLPFAGLAYTLASGGTHTHFMVPTFFAGLIGFLSNLAIAECNGIIMETYDTSDLQPGMTGRPRRALPEEIRKKRTNYSCFPRVTAAFAIAQTFAFLIAAAATGSGGAIERRLGAQTATAVVAAVLLVLTFLLMGVLWRFKVVQMIPSQRFGTNILTGPEDEWKPIIIGNPSGTTRRMSLLELGKQSRWSEIRRRNKLAPEEP